MSKRRNLLIGCGASIIVAIMLTGAFSLGVHLGERGWTAGPPSIMGPGGPLHHQGPRGGPDKQPLAPGRALPKEKPDLVGVVQSVTGRSATVRIHQGPRLVLVSRETRVKRADGEEATLAELRRHVPIAVFGEFSDDGRSLVASLVVILPPKR